MKLFIKGYFLYFIFFLIFPPLIKINAAYNVTETDIRKNSLNKEEKYSLPRYVLGPGDILSIRIYKFDNYDTRLTILPDGSINLPRIKSISLNGLSIDDANNLITNEYKKILKNPIVYLDLIEARPIRVNISGEVQRPGIYTMNTNETNEVSNTDGGEPIIVKSKGWPSVIEIIQKAGGLSSNGDLRKIKLKRFDIEKNEPYEISIDFWQYFNSNALNQNYPVFDGDSIFVPKSTELSEKEKSIISRSNLAPSTITVNVIGEVQKPGRTTISANSPIQKAILNAGGYTSNANKSKITLLRLEENGKIKKKFFKDKNKEYLEEDYLKDRDVVFIDSNLLSKTSEKIELITKPLSPIVNAATIYRVFFGE